MRSITTPLNGLRSVRRFSRSTACRYSTVATSRFSRASRKSASVMRRSASASSRACAERKFCACNSRVRSDFLPAYSWRFSADAMRPSASERTRASSAAEISAADSSCTSTCPVRTRSPRCTSTFSITPSVELRTSTVWFGSIRHSYGLAQAAPAQASSAACTIN